MKTKLIITLTAVLMLVGISAQAQTGNQTPANAENTGLEGDVNHDGKVDVADVTYIVNLIMKNKSEAKDGTYYWYIGVDNPSSISNIQTDNAKPGWHEIGASLNGFKLETSQIHGSESTQPGVVLYTINKRTPYYVVIPNELYIYDDANDDGLYLFDDAECNIPGYKAYLFKDETRIVSGIIIKEGTPVSGVSISTLESSINVGNTLQLEATVSPSNATNQKVTWSSSNPEIATVGETTGLVTGVAVGSATITATSVDGGKTATTTVNVVETLSGYYWYIGTENPASISNIQTDNTVAGWHEIGTSLSGFVLDTNLDENTVILASTIGVYYKYYVIIPNDLHIYNGFNMNIESIDFESVTCNISGYKAFRFVPEQSAEGVRFVSGPIIKE